MTPATRLNQTAILRKALTYGNIPFDESETLRIDSVYPRHRDALLRAASRLANAYPRDVVDATIVDDWVSSHREFMIPIELHDNPEKFGFPSADEWDDSSQWGWMHAHVSKHLQTLEEEVKEHTWIGGMNQLSMADIVWFETLCWIRCGACRHCSAQDLDAYPCLNEYMLAVRMPAPQDGGGRVEGRAMSENKKLNCTRTKTIWILWWSRRRSALLLSPRPRAPQSEASEVRY